MDYTVDTNLVISSILPKDKNNVLVNKFFSIHSRDNDLILLNIVLEEAQEVIMRKYRDASVHILDLLHDEPKLKEFKNKILELKTKYTSINAFIGYIGSLCESHVKDGDYFSAKINITKKSMALRSELMSKLLKITNYNLTLYSISVKDIPQIRKITSHFKNKKTKKESIDDAILSQAILFTINEMSHLDFFTNDKRYSKNAKKYIKNTFPYYPKLDIEVFYLLDWIKEKQMPE